MPDSETTILPAGTSTTRSNVRVLADHAGRRRPPLVLGDQGGPGPRQRLAERPRLGLVRHRPLELAQRHPPLVLVDRLTARPAELFEPDAHEMADSKSACGGLGLVIWAQAPGSG